MPSSRTHYQLSFTARQGMAFFVICLLALGLSFFFGLMAGLSGRPPAPEKAAAAVAPTPAPEVASEASPATPAPPSETRLAGGGADPTPPAVLQTFEDRESEPTAVPAPTRRPAPPPTAAPAAGQWVQVASLASRSEADALAERLSRHGYHAQVAAAQSAKGKVFRVRVGPYATRDEAGRAADRLKRQEKIAQPWVVGEGP